MLKEKCVQLGKSIYKSDGTTLGLHEVFSSLGKSKIPIPEQPRLEELHDLRNTVQHKGLIPDALTAQFHVEIAYDFIKRFLETEMSTPLDEVLPKRYRTLMERLEEPATEVSEEASAQGLALPAILADALSEAWKAENPSSKIIAGYSVLQQTVRILASSVADNEKVKFRGTLRKVAVSHGTEQSAIDEAFIPIFTLRGQVLKGDYEATEEDGLIYLRTVEAILKMVGFSIPKQL